MYVYILICFLLFVVSIFKIKSKFIVYFIIIFLSIIAAIRYNVGGDYRSYRFIHSSIQNSQLIKIEPGYLFLNKILPYYPLLLFFVCVLSLVFVYKFIEKFFLTDTIFLFSIYILLYYLQWQLGTIRQGMSIALFSYSMLFLYKKEYRKYIFILFIASLFHKTAIILLPLILIYMIPEKLMYFFLIIILFFKKLIIHLIFSIIIKYNLSYTSYIFNTVKGMLVTEKIGVIFIFRLLLLLFFIIILFNKKIANNKGKIIFLKRLTIYMFFLSLLLKDFGIAMRIVKYIEIIVILGVVWTLLLLFNKTIIRLIILPLSIGFFLNYAYNSDLYYPYEIIFEKHIHFNEEIKLHPIKYNKVENKLIKKGYTKEEIDKEFKRMRYK